ncbi:hypothetical protein [Vallitalea guaymasensis]|uniref:hypothetical protein n=1 Tax=Vallitalea guaymasensis TaxID=1185412 RepID=UPI000DE2E00F|nr:hypothetical protein [Vallitalea guaymasensis]
MSKSELSSLHYSNSRINVIQSYDGTIASAKRASAVLSGSYKMMHFNYDGEETYIRLRLHWQWSKVPIFTYHDIVGCSISEGMYYDPETSYHNVYYYDKFGRSTRTVRFPVKPNGLTSYVSSIVNMNITPHSDLEQEYAMQGFAYFGWTKIGDIPEVGGFIKYGHSYLTVMPSISVDTGGVSFTLQPANKIKEEYSHYFHEKKIY